MPAPTAPPSAPTPPPAPAASYAGFAPGMTTPDDFDALKAAIRTGGEHRLFRSGKLVGLFPSKAGTCAEAALYALQQGLIEKIRSETKGKLLNSGVESVGSTPAEFAAIIKVDMAKWGKLIRETGMRAD